jgi:hypothetical protein
MSLRSSEVVAGSMFALAFMLVRHDRKKFHEAKISGANAVKEPTRAPYGLLAFSSSHSVVEKWRLRIAPAP